MFTVRVQPCQVRPAILGRSLIFGRLAWPLFLRFLGLRHRWHTIDIAQGLHARVSQIILLLVAVKVTEPIGVGRLNEGPAALDRRLLALEVFGPTGTGHVRNLVPGVPDDDIFVAAQKVGVQKMLDRLDRPVLVRLLLNKYRSRHLTDPVTRVQVFL